MPMGLVDLQRRAAMNDPEAIEQLKMMGSMPPPPQGQSYMGPSGGGLVPPGMPQGMPAPQGGALQTLLRALRGG